MFNFLVDATKVTTGLTQHLKVEQNSRLQHLVVSLYLTIVEQAVSAASLIRDNRRAGVDIILRSSLEAYIDLINLTADADYYNNMLASYHDQWIRLAGGGPTNPYLEKMLGKAEFAAVLQMHKDMLSQLEKKSPPLSVRKRFEKAGKIDIYTSIYNQLCNESHNNIRALSARHIRFENGEPELVMFGHGTEIDQAASLDGFLTVLIDSTLIVHKFMNSAGLAEAEALQNSLHDLYDREVAKYQD